MPRAPRHNLTWSPAGGGYELAVAGRVANRLIPGDEAAWQGWLATADAFAFHGATGGLNVYLEARPRGGRYWYAYHTAGGRTRKRYLGAAARVTLARLEEVAAALAAAPEAVTPALTAPVPDAAVLLPATKLAPPQPPAAPVARERLLITLDAALSTPLTLLSAPAGWGKTTVLAAWARQHPRRVAWLALEAADDTPARFWGALIAALRARRPGVGATALALLHAPQPPPQEAIVAALVNELAGPDDGQVPLALALDDYQTIADGTIHAAIAYLLDHLPAGLRLIIASRSDPALPLARLRARGLLAELRADDLRFTEAEAAAFLCGTLDAPLADDEVAALAARTEGWAAGVQLAALALRGRGDRAAWLAGFTGGHRYLLDYVEDEVLALQDPATSQFLLQVAILPRLGADLCAAVTEEPASADILAELERQNLFIVPLDDERRWYRLHDLFREALLARAAREPELLTAAHQRAARWHADHGDGREAIAHALAAEDHRLGAELIAREAPALWLAGEARAVLGWLRRLPGDLLLCHARLALDAALRFVESLYQTPGAARAAAHVEVERFLDTLAAAAGRAGGDSPDKATALIRRRHGLLHAFIAAQGHLARGDRAGLAALVEETAEGVEREEARWRVVGLGLRFWLHHSLEADGTPLIPQLLAFRDEAAAVGEWQAALTATVWLVSIRQTAGQARLSERECLAGLALASRAGIQTTSTGYLHLYLAELYYAWNRLDEARSALQALFAIARTWQQLDQLVYALGYRARVALLQGAPADADAALDEAEAIARSERAVYHAAFVAAERAHYWLAMGEPASAERWVEGVTFDPTAGFIIKFPAIVASVRVALALGRHAGALATLDNAARHLDRLAESWLVVDCLALRFLALHGAGEHAAARATAARLLALTEPEGRLRVYLDEGAPMAEALAALRDAAADAAPPLPRAYIAHLLAAFDADRRDGVRGGETAISELAIAPTPGSDDAPPMPVDLLTSREREVLQHLATGASNAEIAETLSISPFTVKRHVGSLLSKLGATSRTGAVAHAREADLL